MSQTRTNTFVQTHGRLRTVPGKSYFIGEKSRQVVCPAGCSLFWSSASEAYYTAETVRALQDQFNAQIVRAAMTAWSSWSPGYLTDPARFKAHAITIADAAIALGMYVIIDWHCEGDNAGNVEAAKTFFTEMAQRYANVPNVIYEVWNEPTKQNWNTAIRPYCVAVIDAIRRHDKLNLVLCGTENWSQKVEDAARNPIPDVNVAYVLHFYSNLHGPPLYQNKQSLGVPIFVSEWGTPGEHANTAGFVQWLEKNQVPHVSWAVNNKNEPLSYFTPSCRNFKGPWNPNSDLTPTGKIFLNLLKEWKSTSVPVAPPAPPVPVAPPAPVALRVEAEAYQQRSATGIQNISQVRFTQKQAWILHDLRIPSGGGLFDVQFRVQGSDGGMFRLDYDAGKQIIGVYRIPPSAEWITLKGDCTLPSGDTLRLGICSLSDTEWTLDWILFSKK